MDIPEQLPVDDKPGQPALHEIATSGDGRDITIAYMGALQLVQDTVLSRLGGNYQAYRELRRDDQVHATFQQRRLALLSRPLVIEPGAADAKSVAAADQLRTNLAQIPFDRTNGMMMWGGFYGYSVSECMFENREGKTWLKPFKVKTPWRFRFDQQNQLRLLTRSNMATGELMPPRKFWVTSWGADNDDDPYGLGLAHQLYWPVFFKKQGLGFWLRALEKFGAPSTVVKYPGGADKELVQKALEAARRLRLDGAAALPDTMEMALLEATRGTVDQATFHRQMQAAIAKIILGQTMTTDDGASLSQSQVHMEVREELTDSDAELLCESFQSGPATWLTNWNFPGAAVPIIGRPSPEDQAGKADLATKRGSAIKALREAGLEPENDAAVEAIVGPGWKLAAKPATPPTLALPAPAADRLAAAFAEAFGEVPDAIDGFTGSMDWQPAMTTIRDRILAFVAAQPDLQTAADKLGALFAELGDAGLVELLARASFEARMAGAGGALLQEGHDQAQAAAG